MNTDGDHDRCDHDRDLLGHADGGDDGVEREDDVEERDLDEHAAERDALRRRRDPAPPGPSRLSWISRSLFQIRNSPPTIQDQVAAGDLLSRTVNSGSVSRMIHAIDSSSRIRMTIASIEPEPPRPRLLVLAGSLPARMLMKMMLSMPRTISSAVNVTRASRASAVRSSSIPVRRCSPLVVRFQTMVLVVTAGRHWLLRTLGTFGQRFYTEPHVTVGDFAGLIGRAAELPWPVAVL